VHGGTLVIKGSRLLVNPTAARAVARRVHSGHITRTGEPLIEHVERVARAVPTDACALAYLHDVLERADSAADELQELELTDEELEVLRVLTRRRGESYKRSVMRICRAGGGPGAIARAIKLADLNDHLRHRRHRTRAPDYNWARRQILTSQRSHGESALMHPKTLQS
jgi:hypothetical protein